MFRLLFALLILATSATAQPAEVIRGNGDPMNTQLIGNVRINAASSLERRWIIVNDPSLPARITERLYRGVTIGFGERDFQYRSSFTLALTAPVSAIEVIHIVFDVWNQRVRSLRFDSVADLQIGEHRLSGSWRLGSEAEAVRHYQSLAYISRVRLADGTVLSADLQHVLAEVEGIASGTTLEDLSAAD